MDEQLIALYRAIFKALSDGTRLRIVHMAALTDELPCRTLEEEFDVSKSTISYHIQQLAHAHLISVRRDGRYFHYTLRRDVFNFHLPGFLERLTSAVAPPIGVIGTHLPTSNAN